MECNRVAIVDMIIMNIDAYSLICREAELLNCLLKFVKHVTVLVGISLFCYC